MGQRPKHHQSVGANTWRCPHGYWRDHVVPLITEAQERLGSIKLVSTRIGMNEGWASKVKDHHLNIVTEKSVKLLERLVTDLRNEASVRAAREADAVGVTLDGAALGIRNGDAHMDLLVAPAAMDVKMKRLKQLKRMGAAEVEVEGDVVRATPAPSSASGQRPEVEVEKLPSGDQRTRRHMKEVVTALEANGLTRPEIAMALGYKSWNGVHMAVTTVEHIPRWRLDRAAGVLDALRRGDTAEAEARWKAPRSLDKHEIHDEEAELSGELRRIGPPAKPARVRPPLQDPIPAPRTVPLLAEPEPEPVSDFEKLDKELAAAAALAPLGEAPLDLSKLEKMLASIGQEEAKVEEKPEPPAPTTHEDRIARLRDRLTEDAMMFDEIKKGVPKFLHEAYDKKRDELLNYIQSLE